jgi:hypothetical protein
MEKIDRALVLKSHSFDRASGFRFPAVEGGFVNVSYV